MNKFNKPTCRNARTCISATIWRFLVSEILAFTVISSQQRQLTEKPNKGAEVESGNCSRSEDYGFQRLVTVNIVGREGTGRGGKVEIVSWEGKIVLLLLLGKQDGMGWEGMVMALLIMVVTDQE